MVSTSFLSNRPVLCVLKPLCSSTRISIAIQNICFQISFFDIASLDLASTRNFFSNILILLPILELVSEKGCLKGMAAFWKELCLRTQSNDTLSFHDQYRKCKAVLCRMWESQLVYVQIAKNANWNHLQELSAHIQELKMPNISSFYWTFYIPSEVIVGQFFENTQSCFSFSDALDVFFLILVRRKFDFSFFVSVVQSIPAKRLQATSLILSWSSYNVLERLQCTKAFKHI